MTKFWNWLRAGIVASVVLGTIGVWFSIADYQATQGSGTTFGSKSLGGIHFPSFTLCDATTGGQCATVNSGGAVIISGTQLDTLNNSINSPIPAGSSLIGKVGIDQTNGPSSPRRSVVISGTAAISASAIAALGAGVRFVLTDFSCSNSGATTTVIFFLDGNAAGALPLWQTVAPAAGGSNKSFSPATAVSTTANTALIISTTAASTTVYCSVAGYSGT